jgi:hypothetical protein
MLLFLNSQSIGQNPNGFPKTTLPKVLVHSGVAHWISEIALRLQSIGQLSNGFQILCSLRSQSIGQLPNGLERTQNSQSQIESVG